MTVDLSEFSGEDGQPSFQLLFHADDRGYYASGWAVDDVRVISDDIDSHPLYYKIFLENRQIAHTEDTSYTYYVEYGDTRICNVVAAYLRQQGYF
jgi:hypothetical protein